LPQRRGEGVPGLARILARCRSRGIISFREFERLLAGFGFREVRVSGSHRIYRNELIHRSLSVQPDGKDAKAYQVRMLLGMIDEFGLRLNEDQ
jgi:predicted RNA binding protein YcfA (HicA-like mRNA interferase family)